MVTFGTPSLRIYAGTATLVLAAIQVGTVEAGPTARKLEALGGNVAAPAQPPLGKDAVGKLKGSPVGPIDGGEDRPPYEVEPGKQTVPEGTQIPLPKRRTGTQNPVTAQQQDDETGGRPVPQVATKRNPACIAALRRIAVADAAESPETEEAGCVIPNPVILKSTKGKKPVRFPEGLLLDCSFAVALADFTASVAQPLASHHMGRKIDTILSGQGFVCRRRNNALTGKLSEHATGNATDWIGFRFDDGSQLGVKAAETLKPVERDFLNAVRTSACGYFTTVLGPGSNAAHATHFHFDLGRTSPEKKNPYRICE